MRNEHVFVRQIAANQPEFPSVIPAIERSSRIEHAERFRFASGLIIARDNYLGAVAEVPGKFVEAKARKEWFPVEGFNLEYSRQIKAAVDVPVITVGGFYSKQEMSQAVTSGDTDAVSSARSTIADPSWSNIFAKVRKGLSAIIAIAVWPLRSTSR